jgi:hypothetical protein
VNVYEEAHAVALDLREIACANPDAGRVLDDLTAAIGADPGDARAARVLRDAVWEARDVINLATAEEHVRVYG